MSTICLAVMARNYEPPHCVVCKRDFDPEKGRTDHMCEDCEINPDEYTLGELQDRLGIEDEETLERL